MNERNRLDTEIRSRVRELEGVLAGSVEEPSATGPCWAGAAGYRAAQKKSLSVRSVRSRGSSVDFSRHEASP